MDLIIGLISKDKKDTKLALGLYVGNLASDGKIRKMNNFVSA